MSRSIIALIICLLSVCGCSTWPPARPPPLLMPQPTVTYDGGDGGDPAHAVVIRGAPSTALGITAERDWINKRYKYPRIVGQSLMTRGSNQIDVIECSVTGRTVCVYFDATDFFGKDDVGRWRFTDDKGTVMTGVVSGMDSAEPWLRAISNRPGQLTYQIEDAVNNGLWASGRMAGGKKQGRWRSWRPLDGATLTTFWHGARNGIEMSWYTNAMRRSELRWRNDISDGTCLWWWPNSQLVEQQDYVDGQRVRQPKEIVWHENGRLMSESTYSNGIPYGTWTEWYNNGQKETEKYYVAGEVSGMKCWHRNGSLWRESFQTTNAFSVARLWDAKGELIAEGTFKNEMPWTGTFPDYWGEAKGVHLRRYVDGRQCEVDTDNSATTNAPNQAMQADGAAAPRPDR